MCRRCVGGVSEVHLVLPRAERRRRAARRVGDDLGEERATPVNDREWRGIARRAGDGLGEEEAERHDEAPLDLPEVDLRVEGCPLVHEQVGAQDAEVSPDSASISTSQINQHYSALLGTGSPTAGRALRLAARHARGCVVELGHPLGRGPAEPAARREGHAYSHPPPSPRAPFPRPSRSPREGVARVGRRFDCGLPRAPPAPPAAGRKGSRRALSVSAASSTALATHSGV